MSKNRRKIPPPQPAQATEDPLASRVVALPKTLEPTAANASAKPRAKPERIGDILREIRLERDDDLYQIAEYLCIKPAFLIALENSRYDEFPADAYVIGFLRTYATFLGVDGKDAIDRYRYEMAGRRKKPILSMPTPVSEGRAPSGIIMVGAAVVVLLIYGIWYGISSANRTEINMQPALPTTVQPTSSLPTPSEATAAAGLTSPVAVAPTPVTAAPAPVVTPPPAPVVAEAPPPPPPAPVAMAAPVIPPAAPGIVVTADQAGATATAAKDSKDSKKPTVDSKNAIKPVKNDVVADKAADDGKDKKQIYGDPAATSRLIIRATQSSWVMVTDDSGKAVFDHVLKAGDVYKVPNKPGLSLTTGNGNGIVLTLDGADLPRVANGAPHVVRNIALDPDRLTAEPPAATVEH